MKNTKFITKLALMTALMDTNAATTLLSANASTPVKAYTAPTSTDKVYANIQRISKEPGMHKVTIKWYAN